MKKTFIPTLLAISLSAPLLYGQQPAALSTDKADPFVQREDAGAAAAKPRESNSRRRINITPHPELEESVAKFRVSSTSTNATPAGPKIMEIAAVMDLYEQLTGKVVIRANQVMAGQVYLDPSAWGSKPEGIQVIENTLAVNGFTLINEGERFVTIYGNGVNPRSAGIPVFNSLEKLPESQRVVTYSHRLHFRPAAEMASFASSYIAPSPGNFSFVIADDASGTLIITESVRILRVLIPIIESLDIETKPAAAPGSAAHPKTE